MRFRGVLSDVMHEADLILNTGRRPIREGVGLQWYDRSAGVIS